LCAGAASRLAHGSSAALSGRSDSTPVASWRTRRKKRKCTLPPARTGARVARLFKPSRRERVSMILSIAHLQPIVSLIAGILILIVPRLLNYIVAIFLIVSGVIGLGLLR
jgi:hypothetical protein